MTAPKAKLPSSAQRQIDMNNARMELMQLQRLPQSPERLKVIQGLKDRLQTLEDGEF